MTAPVKIQSIIPPALLICFLLLSLYLPAQKNYPLYIKCVDRDSAFIVNTAAVQTRFDTRADCIAYVNRLPAALQAKGFVTASLDSVFFDSAFAKIVLFLGMQYRWAKINTAPADREMLALSGWNEKLVNGRPMDFMLVKTMQEKILNHFENNGYPFAKIFLDSLTMDTDSVSAVLKIDRGPLYKVDSIRIFGNAKISNRFLQRYLGIQNGSIYNKQKLLAISKKISELTYAEEERPFNMNLLGTGSVLNLYLKPRRSSQVNVLIGFLPNSDQFATKKLLVTGEGNINLRNALGAGETIGLNFQALQVQSQRLNLLYQHPYLFHSPAGLDFLFDMLRKDSSYLNISLNFGIRYAVSQSETGKLFLQNFTTIISNGGINAAQVIATRRLPVIADVNTVAVGAEFEKNKTNYRYNPRSGYEFRLGGSAGTKKIKKNNEILELKDPGDPSFDFDKLYDTVKLNSYQLKLSAMGAKYFSFGRQGVIKTALHAGMFQSDYIFRNELFQIGGYKLLRGFDEENEFVSQYAVATVEYRYLIGLNSFFFVFTDGGWARNTSRISRYTHTYISGGLGMAFETKAGIFNLAWAAGKRNDLPFNLRQSKIHFGFVNYF